MIKIMRLSDVNTEDILIRSTSSDDVSATVAAIIEDVRKGGDSVLFEYTKRFDGVLLEDITVSEKEIDDAFKTTDPEFISVLSEAAKRIRAYHEKQKCDGFVIDDEKGITLGQRVIPIERVGIYVPGGTAAYPSTVLMDSIPAKIAGCKEIVMVTPPASDGSIAPAILAAARIAGIDRIFKVGGAQAIAALAYGTESVPKVDKIVGPGNAYVAEAKKQVFGRVSIDMIAGPSEVLVIADGKSNPAYVAADMLSQAEHDRMASAVLITDSPELANSVALEIDAQIPGLARAEIASSSIETNGKILIADDINEAIETANAIAPEHLELCVDDPFEYLEKIKHAGSVFLGRNCPEALGDYFAGPNHTLPTGGTARFSNPLSVDDFVKKMQYTYYSPDALKEAAPKVALFANTEGLTGHAKSVTIRTEDRK
ncbi:MAG: histidinol dehydrogenase [Firmicutes bacterium]|nr:histidinol dehydrogenase [Bacillota bacterium]